MTNTWTFQFLQGSNKGEFYIPTLMKKDRQVLVTIDPILGSYRCISNSKIWWERKRKSPKLS